jgi:hypothetical protein
VLLNGTFSLLGIQDVEAFCGRIVERSGLRLSVEDREEFLVFLVEECWLLSTRFQHSRISFSSYAGTNLRLRAVDWQRQRFGRTRWVFKDRVYERPRVELVSLDADGGDGELDGPVGGRPLAATADRAPDLARALHSRSRPPAGYDHEVGESAA